MNLPRTRRQKLDMVRKHVLDDIWEIIKARNLAEPLISAPSLNWVKSDAKPAAQFLRMQLSRHVILVLTRLNAIPGKGKTGNTACIMSVLDEAVAIDILSDKDRARFADRLNTMKVNMANQGTSFSDLVNFRNSELAHSLYDLKVGVGALSYFVISQFSEATVELVSDIESHLVSLGCDPVADIGQFDKAWAKCGTDFWALLTP
ncbi:hypothetical protein [Bradyrhizobium sp. 33ap4]|uniref:hypothetical protein n=1 Tax=Bradyrhizobium sp. 33ap4 TaxID=3061630 RepID=UPI00292FD18E|nr:hypothetical protein [Bradyrhizobium sp. 33ap4]